MTKSHIKLCEIPVAFNVDQIKLRKAERTVFGKDLRLKEKKISINTKNIDELKVY